MSPSSLPGSPGEPTAGTRPRVRRGRILTGTVAATAAIGCVLAFGGQGAVAATASQPNSQSVGNFLDATVGGNPLDSIAKLQYAHAKSPGSDGTQNPLNVKVLNALDLPLTGALQLPQLLGIKLGAVNQVAKAEANGRSYGASGAVNNSGGVSVGGNNGAFPANATIDLTAAGIAGNSPIPIPGGVGSAAALGGVTVSIGAVSALAQTPKGVGTTTSTQYNIAGLTIAAKSPLLGGVLGTVTGLLDTVLGSLTGQLGAGLGLPAACQFNGALSDISLEGGAITISAKDGSLTIDLEKLLKQLGLDVNKLPANTDLLDYLLNYITSPAGLTKGLEDAINGLLNPLQAKFDACATALGNVPGIGAILGLLKNLLDTLNSGKTTLQNTINGIVSGLGSVGGVSPLAPLGTALKNLVDIGVNVQQGADAGATNGKFPYSTPLKATPKQGTPVVKGQTTVRAIEVDLLGKSGITLALANAAAGPSNPHAAPPTTTPPTTAPPTTGTPPTTGPPNTNVPTGIPAGMAGHGGSPALPLTLVLLGLMVAGGGAFAWRLRLGKHGA